MPNPTMIQAGTQKVLRNFLLARGLAPNSAEVFIATRLDEAITFVTDHLHRDEKWSTAALRLKQWVALNT